METKELSKCKNCGAELEIKEAYIAKCDYCGSTYTIEKPASDTTDDEEDNDTDQYDDTDDDTNEDQNGIISEDDGTRGYQEVKKHPELTDINRFALPPLTAKTRIFRLYKKSVLISILFWLILYFRRIDMPDGKTNLSQHHTLIFSPIGGDFWYVRCFLFLVVFPVICSIIIFNLKYKNNAALTLIDK